MAKRGKLSFGQRKLQLKWKLGQSIKRARETIAGPDSDAARRAIRSVRRYENMMGNFGSFESKHPRGYHGRFRTK